MRAGVCSHPLLEELCVWDSGRNVLGGGRTSPGHYQSPHANCGYEHPCRTAPALQRCTGLCPTNSGQGRSLFCFLSFKLALCGGDLAVLQSTLPPNHPPLSCNGLNLPCTTHQFRGLYKGMASPIAGVSFLYAICFSSYGWAKKVLEVSPTMTLTLLPCPPPRRLYPTPLSSPSPV